MPTPAMMDLRSLEDDELAVRLKEAKEQLFTVRFQQATGQLDNSSRLRTVKREIARILTVLQERALGIDTTVVEASGTTATASEKK